MTLVQLVYFKKLAETQSFTKAANELFLSQSSLSHSIGELERELGVELVCRTGKQVSLNCFGKSFIKYVETALDIIADGEQRVKQLRDPLCGSLTVYCGQSAAPLFTESVLSRFYAQPEHKRIVISLRSTDADAAELLSRTGNDFAVTGQTCEGLASRPALIQDIALYVPQAHRLAKKKTAALPETAGESFILLRKGSELRSYTDKMLEQSGIVPDAVMCADGLPAVLSAVSLGMGIALLPLGLACPPGAAAVRIDHPLNKRMLYLTWSAKHKLPPLAEYFLDFCLKCLPGGPGRRED